MEASTELLRYIVTKGSVCVDGISLTVMDADDRAFSLSIIPHTWDNTTLKDRRAGDSVNIETDILGKYIEKMLPQIDESPIPSSVMTVARSNGDVKNAAAAWQ